MHLRIPPTIANNAGRSGAYRKAGFVMAKEIPLTNGKSAIVDAEWFDYLSKWVWHENEDGYAIRKEWDGKKNTTIAMHRVIMGDPKGVLVDHWSMVTLDNRLENLRLANKSLNGANCLPRNKAGLPKGVKKRGNSYGARLNTFGKEYWLGSFDNPIDAARAYNEKAKEVFGEFARPNPLTEKEVETLNKAATKSRIDSRQARALISTNKSGLRGVRAAKSGVSWMTHVSLADQSIYLGCHKDKEEAGYIYDQVAIQLFGDNAYLNILYGPYQPLDSASQTLPLPTSE